MTPPSAAARQAALEWLYPTIEEPAHTNEEDIRTLADAFDTYADEKLEQAITKLRGSSNERKTIRSILASLKSTSGAGDE